MKRGRFITIEGVEGAGKTTCMAQIAQQIVGLGVELVQTREPGGTPLGEALREILLSHQYKNVSHDTELLLMFAARAEHIQTKIVPALDAGQWVLCDRFTDATYAYQGAGRGMPLERISFLEDLVQGSLHPDLTLLMDLPIRQGMQRAQKRALPDRFESETQAFFERVRQQYLAMAKDYPERIKLIDASQALDQVAEQVKAVVAAFLQKNA